MKFSIITPSHDVKYMEDLYGSIKRQKYKEWEWIIYLNGKAKKSQLSENIRNDDKVIIFSEKEAKDSTVIGFLKNRAFMKGSGDILVEVDHDDMITTDCLEELYKAFQDPKIGFVHSDDAKLNDGNKKPFTPYSKEHGWTFKTYNWGKKTLFSMDGFDATSQSMAFIYYMPNHVRAWRKSVYLELGGHDESLAVLDDQDLLVRTYLKYKFHHINKCLYINRIIETNTWKARQSAIKTGTINIYRKYAYQLAERECELKGLKKIDLGGGIDGRPGYITMDQENGDIICDLNEGIPLADNSVGVINASHIIEHLYDKQKIISEIHRVLCDGGWAMIEVPSTDGRGAWMDPTHQCYSSDTEVLTEDGWKQITRITLYDRVLTMNLDNQLAEYQDVTQIHKYEYDGKMIHFKSDCMDLLVTPNHNMVRKSNGKNPKTWSFREASDFLKLGNKSNVFSNKINIKEDININKYIELPESIHNNKGWNSRLKYPTEAFMKLLGWYVSEGNVVIRDIDNEQKGKRISYKIYISQCKSVNPKNVDEIINIIKEIGCKPYIDEKSISFNEKGLALFFSTLGIKYNKHIPSWIKRQNPKILKMLLFAAIKGDGTNNGNTGWTYASSSKQLAYDISEIAQLCGYRATLSVEKRGYYKTVHRNKKPSFNKDMYLVYISSRENLYCGAKEISYSGNVHCVGVEKYHTLFVRRNGRAVWSGNSYWNQNSFFYYTRRNQARYIRNNTIKFRDYRLETRFPSKWWRDNDIPVVTAYLCAIKDDNVRRPRNMTI